MLRIGLVSYLNSRPLAGDLEDDDRLQVVELPPAGVARALAAGEVDVGLVPVVALLADDELTYVPELCIGADGPVDSVFLYLRDGFASGGRKRIALDPHSRTSQVLTRVLLEQIEGRAPTDLEYVEQRPVEALETAAVDAVLVIGDLALRLDPGAAWRRVDLAEAWREHTGLPFVFAVWGMKRRLLEREPWLPERFRRALEHGLADLDDVARRSAARHGVGVDVARPYLGARLRYWMREREEQGLALFLDHARRLEGLELRESTDA